MLNIQQIMLEACLCRSREITERTQPDEAYCSVRSVARQTFQVLRLPWMAEVPEPPGAAPVKTWKVSCLPLKQEILFFVVN